MKAVDDELSIQQTGTRINIDEDQQDFNIEITEVLTRPRLGAVSAPTLILQRCPRENFKTAPTSAPTLSDFFWPQNVRV